MSRRSVAITDNTPSIEEAQIQPGQQALRVWNVNAGGGGGDGTEYNRDSAAGATDLGTQILAVRNDTPGSLVDTDGDYTPLQVDADGALRVNAEVTQATHDDLNLNANVQQGDNDVAAGNALFVQPGTGAAFPVTDNGGSLTVDGSVSVSNFPSSLEVTQATHDDLNLNANVQQGDSDVGAANALYVRPGTGAAFPVTDNGGSLTVDGTVTVSDGSRVIVTDETGISEGYDMAIRRLGDGQVVDDDGGPIPMMLVEAEASSFEDLSYVPFRATSDGELRVHVDNDAVRVDGTLDIATVSPGTGNLNLGKSYNQTLPTTTGSVGVAAIVQRQDSLSVSTAANGNGAYLKSDSLGRLYVKTDMPTITKFSASTDGRPITVAATSSPGTTIHVSDDGDTESIHVWASNDSDSAVTLTLQWGSTASSDDVEFTLAPNETRKIIDGAVLQPTGGSATLRAFCSTTNVVQVFGRVEVQS